MPICSAMSRLVGVVQELSLARDLPAVMAIVRRAARELTNADGATFVLRDGDLYFQAGVGIVADSDPELEYRETLDKAAGLIDTLRSRGGVRAKP